MIMLIAKISIKEYVTRINFIPSSFCLVLIYCIETFSKIRLYSVYIKRTNQYKSDAISSLSLSLLISYIVGFTKIPD